MKANNFVTLDDFKSTKIEKAYQPVKIFTPKDADVLEKSDIYYAFQNSYNGNGLIFKKTGKELKEKIQTKLNILTENQSQLFQKKNALQEELEKEGVKFIKNYEYGYYMPDSNDIKSETTVSMQKIEVSEIEKKKQLYWNLHYQCEGLAKDIKFLQTFLNNVNEKQNYNLQMQQLTVLEKSLSVDDMIEKAKSHKYIKRTGTSSNYKYWYKDPSTGKLVAGHKPEFTESSFKKKYGNIPDERFESENIKYSYLQYFEKKGKYFKYNTYAPPGYVNEILFDEIPDDLKTKFEKEKSESKYGRSEEEKKKHDKQEKTMGVSFESKALGSGVRKFKKGDKVKTRDGKIETVIRINSNGNIETEENDYSWPPESLELISKKPLGGSMADDKSIQKSDAFDILNVEELIKSKGPWKKGKKQKDILFTSKHNDKKKVLSVDRKQLKADHPDIDHVDLMDEYEAWAKEHHEDLTLDNFIGYIDENYPDSEYTKVKETAVKEVVRLKLWDEFAGNKSIQKSEAFDILGVDMIEKGDKFRVLHHDTGDTLSSHSSENEAKKAAKKLANESGKSHPVYNESTKDRYHVMPDDK